MTKGAEEAVAEVVLVDLVRESLGAVRKGGSAGGTYPGRADVGILEGIDVDSQAKRMLGEFPHTGFLAVVEAGGVVGSHGGLVIPAEIIDEADAPNRIAGLVQFLENGQEILGNGFIAHQFPDLLMVFEIDIGEPQITEVREFDLRIFRVGYAPHAGFNGRRDGFGRENGFHSGRLHNRFCFRCRRTPLPALTTGKQAQGNGDGQQLFHFPDAAARNIARNASMDLWMSYSSVDSA